MTSLSIKRVLIAGIIGLEVVTVTAILVWSYITTERVFLGHVRQLMESVAADTIDRSERFLRSAQSAADLTQRLADNAILTRDNPTAMERYFYEQLRLYDQFSGLYFGGVDGSFLFVRRIEGSEPAVFQTKIVSPSENETTVRLLDRDIAFKELGARVDPTDKYDPRSRPWFQRAIEKEALIWTDPYIFYSSGNPGITTASPVLDRSGKIYGVVGVDIEIAEISQFLARQKIGQHGSAFIMNRNGDVIAFPNLAKLQLPASGAGRALRFPRIDELDDRASRAAFLSIGRPADAFDLNEPLSTSFELDGNTYHAIFAPFRSAQWPWLMGVYVPEDDFLGAIKENRLHNVYLAILITALACVIGIYLWRSIARPISALGDNALAMKRGELGPVTGIPSGYKEVRQTAEAFDQMATALREARDKLELRVEERTRDLQEEIAMRIQAERQAAAASRTKSRFLANMSHELRTPLNAIMGFSDLMMQPDPGGLDIEKFREYAEDIHTSARHLLELINDVLDLSQIEAGKLDLRERSVSLPMVIESALLFVQLRADSGRVILATDIEPSLPDLWADERRIRQILINLLSNAVKFSPPGSQVKVTARTDSQGLLLSVSDEGVGMTADEIATALSVFGQVRGAVDHRHEGTGLGLPLTLKLVEAHGGTLTLDSAPGQGTTALVRLPTDRLAEAGIEQPISHG